MIDLKPTEAERVDSRELLTFLKDIVSSHAGEQLLFLCIGTDRSTGDSLGPWVGTLLEERGLDGVIGTLRNPCDANTLAKIVRELPEKAVVVAIDACLGRAENIGTFLVRRGPLVPARSVNRSFGPVGAYSIAGIVNANSLKPYWTLQSTSLYQVMEMAREIANAIIGAMNPTNEERMNEDE
ncbi:spore protease YyaC [Cohnella boryungensis]|uniref:Spore protease YyaC n=1 Tax=Cohnella boryungensis TaxID=768479 RepID=A0ABV8SB66_9BACL